MRPFAYARLIVVVLVVSAGAAAQSGASQPAALETAPASSFRLLISVGDEAELTVYGAPDMTQKLLVNSLGQLISFEFRMSLRPAICFNNLFRIRRACEDLRNKRIRIQSDWRD